MAIGDLQGYARTSPQNPTAKGECDRCRRWYQLDELRFQDQWRGTALANTYFRVCRKCLDVPQDQFRAIIMPQDPVPRWQSRPSPDVTGYAIAGSTAVPTNPGNQGFSQYVLGSPSFSSDPSSYPTAQPYNPGPNLTTASGIQITDSHGVAINLSLLNAGAYQDGKNNVLARVAAVSGIPTPTTYIEDRSVTLSPANTSVLALPGQTARGWILFYNPAVAQAQVALSGTAFWGMTTNLILGPGEAYFWANDQGLGNVYTGQLSAIGLTPGMPLWVWQSPGSVYILTDDSGVPITDDVGNWIPLV